MALNLKNRVKGVYGLEFETEVSSDVSSIINQYYMSRDNWASKYWRVDSDGSLEAKKWDYGHCWELVSKPFMKDELNAVLYDLHNIFEGMELSECINLNDTCGAHIHVSYCETDEDEILEVTGLEIDCLDENLDDFISFTEWGKRFCIKGKTVEPKLTMDAVRSIRKETLSFLPKKAADRYFRYYAREIREGNIQQGFTQKYTEWNIINKNHLEFRSFNLEGIETWGQLIAAYSRALKTIDKHMKPALSF